MDFITVFNFVLEYVLRNGPERKSVNTKKFEFKEISAFQHANQNIVKFGRASPSRSSFLDFHALFGEIWSFRIVTPVWDIKDLPLQTQQNPVEHYWRKSRKIF